MTMATSVTEFVNLGSRDERRLPPETLSLLASNPEFALFAASTFELPLERWKQAVQTLTERDYSGIYQVDNPYGHQGNLDLEKCEWLMLKAPARVLEALRGLIPNQHWRTILGRKLSKAAVSKIIPRTDPLVLSTQPDKLVEFLETKKYPMRGAGARGIPFYVLSDEDFVRFAERSFYQPDELASRYVRGELERRICDVLEVRPHLVKELAGNVDWARYLLGTSHWDPAELKTLEKSDAFQYVGYPIRRHPNNNRWPESRIIGATDENFGVFADPFRSLQYVGANFLYLAAKTWLLAYKALTVPNTPVPVAWRDDDIVALAHLDSVPDMYLQTFCWAGTDIAKEAADAGIDGILTPEGHVQNACNQLPRSYHPVVAVDSTLRCWSPIGGRPPRPLPQPKIDEMFDTLLQLPVDAQVQALMLFSGHRDEPEVWEELLGVAAALAN